MSTGHPFDNDIKYDLLPDGNIQITHDGKTGIFTGEGVWISGEIRESDPQLCNWISNVPNPDTQLATSRIAGRDDGKGL